MTPAPVLPNFQKHMRVVRMKGNVNLGNIFVYPYQARNCDEEAYKAIFEGVAEISLQ